MGHAAAASSPRPPRAGQPPAGLPPSLPPAPPSSAASPHGPILLGAAAGRGGRLHRRPPHPGQQPPVQRRDLRGGPGAAAGVRAPLRAGVPLPGFSGDAGGRRGPPRQRPAPGPLRPGQRAARRLPGRHRVPLHQQRHPQQPHRTGGADLIGGVRPAGPVQALRGVHQGHAERGAGLRGAAGCGDLRAGGPPAALPGLHRELHRGGGEDAGLPRALRRGAGAGAAQRPAGSGRAGPGASRAGVGACQLGRPGAPGARGGRPARAGAAPALAGTQRAGDAGEPQPAGPAHPGGEHRGSLAVPRAAARQRCARPTLPAPAWHTAPRAPPAPGPTNQIGAVPSPAPPGGGLGRGSAPGWVLCNGCGVGHCWSVNKSLFPTLGSGQDTGSPPGGGCGAAEKRDVGSVGPELGYGVGGRKPRHPHRVRGDPRGPQGCPLSQPHRWPPSQVPSLPGPCCPPPAAGLRCSSRRAMAPGPTPPHPPVVLRKQGAPSPMPGSAWAAKSPPRLLHTHPPPLHKQLRLPQSPPSSCAPPRDRVRHGG